MESERAVRAMVPPRDDENAMVRGKAARASGRESAGLGVGTTAAAKSPGRAALGNITNVGVGGRGASERARAKEGSEGVRARQSARAGEAKRAEAESSSFLESVKAKLTPAEVVEIRRLAERYVDETDDIEYFAGTTREEQMKELEATQRADVEARVRDLLGDGRGYGPSSVPARSTSADDAFFQTGVKHLKLADDVGAGSFELGMTKDDELDLCNFMSPSKAMGDDDYDDGMDLLRSAPSIDEALAFLDDDIDAMLAA